MKHDWTDGTKLDSNESIVVFIYAIVLLVLTHSLNTFQKPVLYVLYFKDCVDIGTVLIRGGVYQFYHRQKYNKQWWTLSKILGGGGCAN
jgi:hypothetical protein